MQNFNTSVTVMGFQRWVLMLHILLFKDGDFSEDSVRGSVIDLYFVSDNLADNGGNLL